jgi:hypothetical protein
MVFIILLIILSFSVLICSVISKSSLMCSSSVLEMSTFDVQTSLYAEDRGFQVPMTLEHGNIVGIQCLRYGTLLIRSCYQLSIKSLLINFQ